MTDDEHGFIFDVFILKHFESDIVRSKQHFFVSTQCVFAEKNSTITVHTVYTLCTIYASMMLGQTDCSTVDEFPIATNPGMGFLQLLLQDPKDIRTRTPTQL